MYEPGNVNLQQHCQTFQVVNNTDILLILRIAPQPDPDEVQVGGGFRYLRDQLIENTQRLLLPPGRSQDVNPPTALGAYVTVCMELDTVRRKRDVLVGDAARFVQRDDRLTFTILRA
jgi:hypothetical protein